MILESIIGGSVIAIASVGACSVCCRVRQRLTRWFGSPQSEEVLHENAVIDPTPSFTVDLVRTVLEHQALREDQSRRQLTMLLMQLATAQKHCSPIAHDVDNAELEPVSTRNDIARPKNGFVAKVVRRFLPAARQ
jgi:hypothetical protein